MKKLQENTCNHGKILEKKKVLPKISETKIEIQEQYYKFMKTHIFHIMFFLNGLSFVL